METRAVRTTKFGFKTAQFWEPTCTIAGLSDVRFDSQFLKQLVRKLYPEGILWVQLFQNAGQLGDHSAEFVIPVQKTASLSQ